MKPFVFLPLAFALLSFSTLSAQSALDAPYDPLADQVAGYIDHFELADLLEDACPADTCACSGGYLEIQVYYFGEDNVDINIYSDADLTDLIVSYPATNSGQLLVIDGTGLVNGILMPYTYLHVTYPGGDECTTRLYTRCPTNAWPGALDDLEILGKTFREFTVFAVTDEDNNQECTISSTDQDWHVGGNIIGPANNTLGSRTDESVVLITNDTERGIITNTGQFGLGTQSPGALLDVDGDVNITSTLDVGGVTTIHDTTPTVDPADGALVVAGGAGIGQNLAVGNDASITNNLRVGNNAAVVNDLTVGNNATVDVDLSVGNDGEIGNDLRVLNDAAVENNLAVGNDATVDFDLSVGENTDIGADLSVGNNTDIANNLSVGADGRFGGTLQIGTEAVPAGYLVAVDGNIICEEVRVQLSEDWPDYVFAKDYPLLSLKEVEQAIAEKGHLPASPSAAEVEEEGLPLSEVVTIQQQQIEELFLHLIEMDKKLDQLEEENRSLRQQQSIDRK